MEEVDPRRLFADGTNLECFIMDAGNVGDDGSEGGADEDDEWLGWRLLARVFCISTAFDPVGSQSMLSAVSRLGCVAQRVAGIVADDVKDVEAVVDDVETERPSPEAYSLLWSMALSVLVELRPLFDHHSVSVINDDRCSLGLLDVSPTAILSDSAAGCSAVESLGAKDMGSAATFSAAGDRAGHVSLRGMAVMDVSPSSIVSMTGSINIVGESSHSWICCH